MCPYSMLVDCIFQLYAHLTLHHNAGYFLVRVSPGAIAASFVGGH